VTDVNPLQTSDPLGTLLGIGAAASRFPPNSRYLGIATATIVMADGRSVVYLRRRFVPAPEGLALLQERIVAQGERLDGIAADALGDPELFWRIADGNRAMRPEALTEPVGRRLRVTLSEQVKGVAGG
jgi:hypothetical protein